MALRRGTDSTQSRGLSPQVGGSLSGGMRFLPRNRSGEAAAKRASASQFTGEGLKSKRFHHTYRLFT